jgi:hypothetical protein
MSKSPTETQSKKPESAEAPGKGGKSGASGVVGACLCWGCKADAKQFNFCHEHYDHFKFGLIKKTGAPVPDYEKKFEHYQAHKAKRAAHKVA